MGGIQTVDDHDENYKILIVFKKMTEEVKVVINVISDYAKGRCLKVKQDDTRLEIEGTGLPGDFSYMGVIITSLKKAPLFYENAETWIFYDMDGYGEDLLKRYGLN